MSFSRDPTFAQSNVGFRVNLTAAKTTRSGVTDAVLLYTAPAEGAWFKRVWVRPGDTLATATRVDLYVSPDGSAALPIDSVLMSVATVSATVDITEQQFTKWTEDTPLRLGPNERLYGGLSAAFASGMVICGMGESFASPALASVTASEGTATT